MAAKSYVGDVGTLITLATGADLTEAETVIIKVRIRREENVREIFERFIDWSASVRSPATSGVLEHIIQQGEFAESGEYSVAAYVVFSDGSRYTGETATFTVHETFA